jgi:hypothetical protein
MKATFFSMVMSRFQYLVTEYGFVVKKVENSERTREFEGRIEFETSTTFVTVSSEQWMAGASVGRVRDDKYRFFLDPLTIYEYIVLAASDKKLVCSLNPQDDRKARMIMRQTRLFSTQNDDSNNVVENIESQLSNHSNWLRQYAEPFLRGDFSQWLEIYEYKVFRARAAHIRSGKEEFVRTTSRHKEELVSVFQSNLDYLKSLREEYRMG